MNKSELINALADPHFPACVQQVARYQSAVMTKGRQLIREYDRKIAGGGDAALAGEANEKLCAMAREQTIDTLNKVLLEATARMKNGYNLADN